MFSEIDWLGRIGTFIVAAAGGAATVWGFLRKHRVTNAHLQRDAHDQIIKEYQTIVSTLQSKTITLEAELNSVRVSYFTTARMTERMKVELYYLQGQIEQLQLTAAGLPVMNEAIVVSDQSGTVVEWNPAATLLFHWTSSEAIGQNIEILMPERYLERHRTAWKDVRDVQRLPRRGPVLAHGRTRDGEEVAVALYYSGWVSHGQQFFAANIRPRKDDGSLGAGPYTVPPSATEGRRRRNDPSTQIIPAGDANVTQTPIPLPSSPEPQTPPVPGNN